MWPPAVVVGGVGPKDPLEVAAAKDDCPVQALGSDSADPALGECVSPRRLDRGHDDLHGLRAEHLVEGSRELRVPISDHEPDASEPLPHRQVPGLLGDPRRVGIPGDARTWTRLDPISIAKSTYSVRSQA